MKTSVTTPTVVLEHNTPLWVAAQAIRQCWQSQGKSDTACVMHPVGPGVNTSVPSEDQVAIINHRYVGPEDKALIDRIGNKFKHASTLEHLSYNFTISDVSRALLQELARHRMASPSVKSSRYTLKELKLEESFYVESDFKCQSTPVGVRAGKYLVYTGVDRVDHDSIHALDRLRDSIAAGVTNDVAKYCMPESFKTQLAWTINARSLQNFLSLRSSKAALWEIRSLAQAVYDALPEDHKYLFTHCLEESHGC